VQRWRAEPSALILMVQDPVKRRGVDEKYLQTRYPRTYGYLKRFEPMLRQRSVFKRYFTRPERGGKVTETGPFYSMFAVGDYTFAPWKVVWRYVASDFIIAVAALHNGRSVVPNEKLMLVACTSAEEAHYLCATLNSSPIRLAVRGFFVETQIAPHVIGRLCISRYNPGNSVHRRLAELSQAAHQAARREDAAELARIEAEIDHRAAQLWNLSENELREIQQSLRELAGEEQPQVLEEKC
jgi:hypothetical protein